MIQTKKNESGTSNLIHRNIYIKEYSEKNSHNYTKQNMYLHNNYRPFHLLQSYHKEFLKKINNPLTSMETMQEIRVDHIYFTFQVKNVGFIVCNLKCGFFKFGFIVFSALYGVNVIFCISCQYSNWSSKWI
jgi:hypothetical protein